MSCFQSVRLIASRGFSLLSGRSHQTAMISGGLGELHHRGSCYLYVQLLSVCYQLPAGEGSGAAGGDADDWEGDWPF